MAVPHLTVFSTPEFPQTFEDAAHYEIRRVAGICRANYEQAYICHYDWSDEWCDCKGKATVHDLKSEQEFCAWHFRVVEARRNRESHDLVLPASRCRVRARASRYAQRLRARTGWKRVTEKALAEFQSLYNRREMAAYQLVGAVRTLLAFFEAQQFDQAEAALRRAYQDYEDADQSVTEFFNSREENQVA